MRTGVENMPKVKNHIIQNKKDYLYIAVSIGVSIFCILLIGRVGVAGQMLALFFSFLFGDFSTLILAFILGYSVFFLVFKKKIDFHHISFIGIVLISLSLLLFAHLGLYNPLGMTHTTVLSKTMELYKHYLKNYNISFSCGGGLVGALMLQVSCLLVSRVGSILIGIAMLLVGISYIANIKFFSIFKGGKISKIPKNIIAKTKNYFKTIHYPSMDKKPSKKISINSLEDTETQVNFTLQNEINKEKFDELKRFIRDKRIIGNLNQYYTSFSASRMIVRLPSADENNIKLIQGFFNRQCIILKHDAEYFIDYANQFRKLLTLKSLLLSEEKFSDIPIAIEVDGSRIGLDMTSGRLISVLGDYSSGVKTFIRCFVLSLLIKNINYSEIYFYDFNNDFQAMNHANFKYVNNEKSASIALDEAFSEYERRSEVLKYFNCDSIFEANQQIKKTNADMELMYPEFHILVVPIGGVSQGLLQKITYAIHFSIRVGISMLIVARDKNDLSKIDLNKSDIICFNVSDVSTSLKLFGSDIACRLQKKGDVLIRKDGVIYHGQTAYVSTTDFDKMIVG